MLKGGIKTAHNKSLKKSYRCLNRQQKRLVKIHERYDLANKFLYGYKGFYSTVNRLTNNCVDWDSVDDNKMQMFTDCNKDIQRYTKQDDDLMDNALIKFNQTQFTAGDSLPQGISPGYQ